MKWPDRVMRALRNRWALSEYCADERYARKQSTRIEGRRRRIDPRTYVVRHAITGPAVYYVCTIESNGIQIQTQQTVAQYMQGTLLLPGIPADLNPSTRAAIHRRQQVIAHQATGQWIPLPRAWSDKVQLPYRDRSYV